MAIRGGWENRLRYLNAHGLDPRRTVHADLCHGTNVVVVGAAEGGSVVSQTDGLITDAIDVGLAMTGADCLLLTVYDTASSRIGILHAGRRGLAQGVIKHFFAAWRSRPHGNFGGVHVDISPSICQQHYPISPLDATAFSAWPEACRSAAEGVYVDLRSVALAQLRVAGIPSEHVIVSPICTFEDQRYFSYRRDHPPTPQLQVGYIVRRSLDGSIDEQ